MKTAPTIKAGQKGRVENSLHLPVSTGSEKTDRLVVCFER